MKKKIRGKVVRGHGLGRTLGFPTVNIHGRFDFPHGVYGCVVLLGKRKLIGALHFGIKKTIGEVGESLEIHLLDFEGDLYGKDLEIEVYNKVREVKKFENSDELAEAILKDVEAVRKLKLL